MKIYLASKSPRRQELLRQMELDFELLFVDTPEEQAPNESPETYSKRVTLDKLTHSWNKLIEENLQPLPILCADTEVILDEKILGKPENDAAAFRMLKSLAGKSHSVLTSVGLRYYDYQKILTNQTTVTFAPMLDTQIMHYVATGDYQDKSGGYGIQTLIGQFISHIDGCFYSVMGLPLNTVRLLLADLSIHGVRS